MHPTQKKNTAQNMERPHTASTSLASFSCSLVSSTSSMRKMTFSTAERWRQCFPRQWWSSSTLYSSMASPNSWLQSVSAKHQTQHPQCALSFTVIFSSQGQDIEKNKLCYWCKSPMKYKMHQGAHYQVISVDH